MADIYRRRSRSRDCEDDMTNYFLADLSSSGPREHLNRFTAPFRGYGMERIPGLRTLYNVIYSAVALEGQRDVSVDGLRLRVDFKDRSIVPSLWLTGKYEPTYSRAIDSLVAPGSQFYDIGAHIGYYSVRLASRDVRVNAFEPCVDNQRLLRHNIERNAVESKIVLSKLALSDASGEGLLWVDSRNTGAASLSFGCVDNPVASNDVQISTLDAQAEGASPNMIKIDVQGAEFAVVRGAMNTIERTRPVLALEYNPSQIETFGDSPLDLLDMLSRESYRLYYIDEALGRIEPGSPGHIHSRCVDEKSDGTGFMNLIVHPAERDPWL